MDNSDTRNRPSSTKKSERHSQKPFRRLPDSARLEQWPGVNYEYKAMSEEKHEICWDDKSTSSSTEMGINTDLERRLKPSQFAP